MTDLKRLCAVLSLIILFSSAAISFANIPYTVRKGDTLQRISRKYNVGIVDIKESNRLKSNKLSVGRRLSLPVSEKKHASRHQAANRPGSENNAIVHMVKKGETLKSIARKYKVSPSELKKMNNLKHAKLKAGQQIVVRAGNHTPETYTVRKGDTVRKVARRFKLSNEELREINGLKGNFLKPGRKLLLAKADRSPKENPAEPALVGNEKTTPAIASARLNEVKELSISEDILADLSIQERLVLFAKKMLHLPYRFGGTGSVGMDCSAYVQKAYSLIGQNIPRSAREQFTLGQTVDKGDLTIGDLVFFRTYASFPSHVGIYLGNNLFIHASSLSRKVTIDSLESPYYFQRFIGAKRIIPEGDFDIASSETALKAN